jgi:hypothetical protein
MPRDFDDDFYVIDEGEPDEVGLGHRGEDNQEIVPAGAPLPRRRGGQTVYQPRYAAEAERLCKIGLTDEELAEFFNVHRTTIYRWCADHPDFAEAIMIGKEATDDRVEKSLYRRANGYDIRVEKLFSYQGEISRATVIEHVPPDPKSMIFWLKNRRRDKWRDVSEFTGAGGKPLIPQDPVTAKELARYLAFVVSQGAKQIDAEAVDADVQYLPAPESKDEADGS